MPKNRFTDDALTDLIEQAVDAHDQFEASFRNVVKHLNAATRYAVGEVRNAGGRKDRRGQRDWTEIANIVDDHAKELDKRRKTLTSARYVKYLRLQEQWLGDRVPWHVFDPEVDARFREELEELESKGPGRRS